MSEKNNIIVESEPHYLASKSAPEENRYVFAHTISISNVGSVAAKLLSRHWLITDANGKIEEVRGPGVIGEQPHIKPGEMFRYTSGAILETPVGIMQGQYFLISDEGENFKTTIPKFTLSIPRILH